MKFGKNVQPLRQISLLTFQRSKSKFVVNIAVLAPNRILHLRKLRNRYPGLMSPNGKPAGKGEEGTGAMGKKRREKVEEKRKEGEKGKGGGCEKMEKVNGGDGRPRGDTVCVLDEMLQSSGRLR